MEVKFFFTFLVKFLELYKWVLFTRIILSWMPSIDWYKQPWKAIDDITEPVMAPFRRLIPPIGGVMDVSPIVMFIALDILLGLLSHSAGLS